MKICIRFATALCLSLLKVKITFHLLFLTGYANLQIYEVFSNLALSAKYSSDSYGSSFANELFMVVRKQVEDTNRST